MHSVSVSLYLQTPLISTMYYGNNWNTCLSKVSSQQGIGNSAQNYWNSNGNSGQKSYWILQYAIIDPLKNYCNNAICNIYQHAHYLIFIHLTLGIYLFQTWSIFWRYWDLKSSQHFHMPIRNLNLPPKKSARSSSACHVSFSARVC